MDFLKLLSAAGIPTTQAELEAIWRNTIAATGSTINNDSVMSPFWRLVTALITNPVLWLVNFIAVTVMPNAYVKYATGEYLDTLADAVNLTRKPAQFAVGIVRFTRTDVNAAITIPINTLIKTALINGVVYQLKTTAALSFASGELTLDVPVIATLAGTGHNLASGYYTQLVASILGVSAVINPLSWITTPGADIESDADLRARIRNQFGTAAKFHTDAVYKSMISEFIGVHVDAIWIVHPAIRGPGTANIYVLFDFSVDASIYLAQINDYLMTQGHHGHGDDVLVLQMPEQNVMLSVTVWAENYLTDSEKNTLKSGVEDMINAAFRENTAYPVTLTLPYNRFSFSKLSEELHNEFSAIHSVAFSLDDIVSELWIPRLTSLTVTVQSTE
jgi:uncharacterized phage protein gp47/JayE